MPDLIAQYRREISALCDEHGRERRRRILEKAEAARSVGVQRIQSQAQPRHAPQERVPDEQPEVPAEEDEARDRQAHESEPVPGFRQPHRSIDGDHVPRGDVQAAVRAPKPIAARERQQEERHFGEKRIPKAHCAGDEVVEARPILRGHQVATYELRNELPEPAVDQDLRPDQEGQRRHELKVREVEKKRHRAAHEPPRERRQQRRRKPGDRDEREYAAPDQPERRPRQPRPQEELVERTAQYE